MPRRKDNPRNRAKHGLPLHEGQIAVSPSSATPSLREPGPVDERLANDLLKQCNVELFSHLLGRSPQAINSPTLPNHLPKPSLPNTPPSSLPQTTLPKPPSRTPPPSPQPSLLPPPSRHPKLLMCVTVRTLCLLVSSVSVILSVARAVIHNMLHLIVRQGCDLFKIIPQAHTMVMMPVPHLDTPHLTTLTTHTPLPPQPPIFEFDFGPV